MLSTYGSSFDIASPNTFFNSTSRVFSLSFSDPFCLQHVTNCKGSSDLLIQGYKVFNTEDN